MTDVYVYYFLRRVSGEKILSQRRATLDAIKDRGQALMESQIVVDHTEVDAEGFVIGGISSDLPPVNGLWAEIRSLELRATSRDREALTLDWERDDSRIYLLRLESRELRKQAKQLRDQRAGSMSSEVSNHVDPQVFVRFRGIQQRDRRT